MFFRVLFAPKDTQSPGRRSRGPGSVVIHAFCHYTAAMEWGGDTSRRGHAFISYVREDKRRVDRLQEFLEANGVPVWRDTARLWPGEDWNDKIREAIAADSLAFIACFSRNSETKQKSYQRDELRLAIKQLHLRSPDRPYLLPVRFDAYPIPDWEIGPGRTLRSLQWVDLYGKQWPANAEKLLEGIQHILQPPLEDTRRHRGTAKPQPAVETPSDSGSRRGGTGFIRRLSLLQRVAAGLAFAVVIALATVVGIHLAAAGPSHSRSTPLSSPSGRAASTSSTSLSATSVPPGVRVTDATKTVSVIVPKSWNQVWSGWSPQQHIPGIVYRTNIGQGLNASPNVQNWFSDLTTPGIFVGASKLLVTDHFTPAIALTTFGTECEFFSQQAATFDHLSGYLDMWTCPTSTTRFETVALWPANHSFIAFVELKIVTPADEASGMRALDSLSIRY